MKTKLTPELQKNLIKYIEDGSYIVVACKAVGISKVTFYDWIKRGEAGEKLYLNFLNAIQQATAQGEIEILEEIRPQVRKDWRVGMEILARKYPQRWARRDKLEVKTKKTVISKQVIEFRKAEKVLTDEERGQFIKIALKTEKEISGNGNRPTADK